MTNLTEHLRRLARPADPELSDGELLGLLIEHRDETALTALIRRHGPMVWGTCRRILAHHDAEDAFQATFLVLVRKATSVRPRELVGNWLHGVAYQTARHAQRTAARRKAREVQMKQMPEPEAARPTPWCDVSPVLDEELNHLPEVYRAVIVLCDLEGRTRKEVARQLGIPEGTVGGRLARARALLAKRLTRRGVTATGSALVLLLSQASSASVPGTIISSAINTACGAAGYAAAGHIIPHQVAALTEGVLKSMPVRELKTAVAVMLLVAALCGATGLMRHAHAEQALEAPEPATGRKDPGKNAKVESDYERLQGEWEVVSGTFNGEELDPNKALIGRITIKGKTLRIHEWATAKPNEVKTSYDRFRLNEAVNPKIIHTVKGKADDLFDLTEFDKRFEDAKEKGESIYSIDNGVLKLCSGPQDGARPTTFESKKGSQTHLLVFKRVPTERK